MRHCPRKAGSVFEFEMASVSFLTLAKLYGQLLLLSSFLLGLLLGFRHGTSPVVTG